MIRVLFAFLLSLLLSGQAFAQYMPPAAAPTGSTNITTLGTITTGVWNGTAIPLTHGGTGGANAAAARTALGVAAMPSNAGTIFYTTVNLSAADIDGLAATPKALVAAQGSGNIIVVDRIVIKTTYSGTAFTGGGNIYAQPTGGSQITSNLNSNTFTTAANRVAEITGLTSSANLTTRDNVGVELTCASDFTGSGTTTAVVHVWYRVVAI